MFVCRCSNKQSGVRIFLVFAGYVSRCCSDTDDSTDEDDPMDSHNYKRPDPASQDWEERRREEEEKRREEERKEREEHKGKQEVKIIVTTEGKENEGEEEGATGSGLRKFSMMDDEMNLETTWYHTDPRVTSSFSSLSSGSLSAALEESSPAAKTTSRLDARRGQCMGEDLPSLDVHHPYLLEPKSHQGPLRPTNLNYRSNDNSCLCFAELSKADFLPSPPEATSDDDDDDEEEDEEQGVEKLRRISKIPSSRDLRMIDSTPFQRSPIKRKKKTPPKVPLRTSSIPGHKAGQAEHRFSKDEDSLFLTPSPNPKPALLVKEMASESEEEFFDAQDRFTPPVPDLSGLLTACLFFLW